MFVEFWCPFISSVIAVGHPSTMVITTEEILTHAYIRKQNQKGKKRQTSQEETSFLKSWWKIKRKACLVMSLLSLSSDISFYPAEGLNLSDICVGCVSLLVLQDWALGRANLSIKDGLGISLTDPRTAVGGQRLFCSLIMSRSGQYPTALLLTLSF